MDQKIKASLGIMVLIIIAFTIGLFIWHYGTSQSIDETQIANLVPKNKLANPVTCTEEAKECSDGSHVSRTEPNCEFAPCPENTFATFTHKQPTIENVMCREDAKQCSDGSLVYRAGLDCEFTPCPGEKSPSIVGGACQYQSVPGNCKVISFPSEDSDVTTKFTFTATNKLPDSPLVKSLTGEHTSFNNISNIPLKINDPIVCSAELITSGTCTPIIFYFISNNESMQELKTYRNEKLGIEIKVPQLASNNGGPNIDKVTVIESDDSIVWITIKNDNQLEASKQQLSDSVSDYKKVSGIPWAILVKKVKNDVDLEEFIQMRYGKACKLKSKQLSTQPGILNVDIEGSGPESDCFLNFVKKVKYSPEKELVAAWDIGQAPKFFDKNEMALDELMSSSFKFIK